MGYDIFNLENWNFVRKVRPLNLPGQFQYWIEIGMPLQEWKWVKSASPGNLMTIKHCSASSSEDLCKKKQANIYHVYHVAHRIRGIYGLKVSFNSASLPPQGVWQISAMCRIWRGCKRWTWPTLKLTDLHKMQININLINVAFWCSREPWADPIHKMHIIACCILISV